MRKLIAIIVLLPSIGFCRTCDIRNVLPDIRPGAEWAVSGTDYAGIDWLDKTQTKPTASEVQAAIDACTFSNTPAQVNLKQRSDAINDLLAGTDDRAKLVRAILMVLFDENNNSRGWIQSFKAAVAASTSLADFKTRVAALPDMPDRTVAQAKQAVQNKLDSGQAD